MPAPLGRAGWWRERERHLMPCDTVTIDDLVGFSPSRLAHIHLWHSMLVIFLLAHCNQAGEREREREREKEKVEVRWRGGEGFRSTGSIDTLSNKSPTTGIQGLLFFFSISLSLSSRLSTNDWLLSHPLLAPFHLLLLLPLVGGRLLQ